MEPQGRTRVEPPPSVSGPGAAFLGFGALGLGTGVHVAIADPPASLRSVAHLAYALFHPLFLGVVLAIGLTAALALRDRPRWLRASAGILASIALAAAVVPAEVAHFAGRVAPGYELAIVGVLTVAFGLSTPLAWLAGVPLRRPRLRWLALAAACAAALIEPRVLTGLYSGLHLHGRWLAGVFAASAVIGTAPLLSRATFRRASMAAALVGAFASVLVPAPLAVRSALARDGAVLLPLLPWPTPQAGAEVRSNDWYRPAAEREPAPPSDVPRPVTSPVVILVTVDSLRADVLERDDTRRQLPFLRRLAARGAHFTRAHAPGSMTVTSLTSLFSGTHFSQQRWGPIEGAGGLWPHADRHVRFPELLRDAGVRTIHVPGTNWLVERFGIVRGFEVEQHRLAEHPDGRNRRWIHSVDSVPRLMTELTRLGRERPGFLYAHMMDPHSPYTAGGRRPTRWQSYVAELAVVDAQLARLWAHVERLHLTDRTYLIVTSDHGEGFREHGALDHAYGLYEELVHVPLIIAGPGIAPRREAALVSLTDLGPTILDLFERPTPAQFVGQSLLPLAMGQRSVLTRPVLAETRLMRALVRPEGVKVIRDLRRGTLEIYDLRADPGEQHDRVGDPTPGMLEAVGELDAFFEVHQLREGGYEPPLRM